MPRVWISYEPQLFNDVLSEFIQTIETVEIVSSPTEKVDIALLRLAATGQLQDYFHHRPLPDSKVIAFSSKGDRAYIRLPNEKTWTEIEPFGLEELHREILAGCGRPEE